MSDAYSTLRKRKGEEGGGDHGPPRKSQFRRERLGQEEHSTEDSGDDGSYVPSSEDSDDDEFMEESPEMIEESIAYLKSIRSRVLEAAAKEKEQSEKHKHKENPREAEQAEGVTRLKAGQEHGDGSEGAVEEVPVDVHSNAGLRGGGQQGGVLPGSSESYQTKSESNQSKADRDRDLLLHAKLDKITQEFDKVMKMEKHVEKEKQHKDVFEAKGNPTWMKVCLASGVAFFFFFRSEEVV